jgi:hypothetical protein
MKVFLLGIVVGFNLGFAFDVLLSFQKISKLEQIVEKYKRRIDDLLFAKKEASNACTCKR